MARHTRIAPLLVLALACATVGAGRAAAQTTTASVQGVVRDASGAVLPGASVTLRDVNTGFARATTSDRTGAYVLPFVPAGAYELTVDLSGFKTLKRERLQFDVGQESTIDATLEIASVAETVTVREQAPVVETTKSTVDQVIHRAQIDSLPLTGRQAATLALLAPGVVQRGTDTSEPVTAGGQPRGSGETLGDGVRTEMMATNSIRSNAPPDAIEEFQVLTNQYQAEFGNATGVILNTITRSGTNDLHGRAYYFHRDEALDARNFFSPTRAAFEQKQGGGWLGGPIQRDRTHYFVTYEGTRRMTIATVTSPAAPGDVERPFDNNQLLAKATHQINKSNRLEARFSLDRPTQDNVGVGGITLEEAGAKQLNEDLAYVGSLATILSNRALNELRVQVAHSPVELIAKHPDVFTIMRPTSTSGKLSNTPQAFVENRVQAVDNLTYERDRHRIKVGLDINRLVLDGYVYQNNPGVFTFSTDRPFNAADLTTYPISFIGNAGDPKFRMVSTGFAAFAQDGWRLPRHVTLNVGLRYDLWDVQGLDLQKGNFAPRAGVAWDPLGTGKTSIRGGYGIFYNNVLTNVTLFTSFLANQPSLQVSNPGYPDPYSRGGTVTRPPLSTYVAEANQPLPRAYHATAGVQRELLRGISVSADYVNSKGRHLIRIVDTNAPVPPTFTRPDATHGFVRRLESQGFSDYDGLLLSGKGNVGDRGMVQVAYTLSSYKSTTDAENAVYQQDDLNPDEAYGYGQYDQRHRAVIGGYYTLPLQIQIGAVLTGRSGVPFNITTGSDNNRNNNINDRPDLAPGARVGTDDMLDRASFVSPGARPGNLPRNAGRGGPFWQLDARIAKRMRVGRAQAEALIEAFNLANHTNFGTPIGNLASSSFGKPSTAFDSRQVQLGFRFEF